MPNKPAMIKAALPSAWMTPQDAADYLKVSATTIYRACQSQGLRYVKVGHSTIRLRRDWIDEWLDERTQQHIPADGVKHA